MKPSYLQVFLWWSESLRLEGVVSQSLYPSPLLGPTHGTGVGGIQLVTETSSILGLS